MQCAFCLRPFNKSEYARRAEKRQAGSGPVLVYGEGMPAGPLSAASGPLVSVLHRKCWYADEARRTLEEARAADPQSQSDLAPDWREPVTVDLKGVIGEGNRDDRGAGALG